MSRKRVSLGDLCRESGRLLHDWAFVGPFQPHRQRRQQLGLVPVSGTLRRVYHLLNFLQRGTDYAAIREYLGICRIHCFKRQHRCCFGSAGLLSLPLNSHLSNKIILGIRVGDSLYIYSGTCPCRLSTKAVKGNHLLPCTSETMRTSSSSSNSR